MEATSPTPVVLVVDDDAGLARLIEKSLRRHGYATDSAASGQAAIGWLGRRRADLLLIDLQLADMSGRDIISHLAERQRLTPFVIITGQGDERVAVEMMKKGALDYLVKDKEFLEFVPVMVERALRQIEREKKLALAEDAWRQESALTAAILDTSGALILVLDAQDRIVRFNHACERTTGYSLEEVQGKRVWDLFRTPQESVAVRKILARLHEGEFPMRYENHWLTREGERRLIAWSSTILRDQSGALQHIISSGIDITERHRAEIRLGLQYAVTRALAD
ncbi:MAG: PAS domain S-box protein, partial [Pedosphaera parvula]|nr:PAS domain S-box protein [Pedosphaera parvula]